MVDTPAGLGDISTATGARIFIGPVALPLVDTQAEFAALTPYLEIGMVESVGEFGDEANKVTPSPLGQARVRKAKGVADAGSSRLPSVYHDPLDAGQAAMIACAEPLYRKKRAFKVILRDAPDEANYTNTAIYFRGLVMSRRRNVGGADNVLRITFNIEIDSNLAEVLAALLP
ncbi:iron ABC transporter substrate-binding protein [Hansschlegelia sp. KR7-227]|uniref:iron ABC transporter substrate-binding protein n=1 Tax=Hansschlegelia sp. KR7-227 TaxID=3400914 RepID=UPI003C016BBD